VGVALWQPVTLSKTNQGTLSASAVVEMRMPYRIAGIDVHKAMLAVVVADVEVEGDWEFTRRRFGATPNQLRLLTEWLVEHEVEETVMESTAQYWRPVWDALERDWQPTQRRRGAARADHRRAASCAGRRPIKADTVGSGISPMPSDW